MRKGIKGCILALTVVMAMAFLAGCGTDDIDISGYEDKTITLTGIAEEDVPITVKELKAMECRTVKAESTSDKIGKVRATGPTLETVLAAQGVSIQDIDQIKVTASDGYEAKIGREILEEDDVFLAFGIDGKPLDEENAPVRLIIPGSDSAYWIRMVEKIDCNRAE